MFFRQPANQLPPYRNLRTEWKYVVDYRTREMLLGRWSPFLIKDSFTNEHALYPILSQYYDSPQLHCYYEKVFGRPHRRKVRLRTYGYRFRPGQATFLEIKQRIYDRGRKVRCPISNFREDLLLDPSQWSFDKKAQEADFGYLNAKYRLRPTAQTFYVREAYRGVVEPDVRVTFDSVLVGMFPGEELTESMMADHTRNFVPDGYYVLEVKWGATPPRWAMEGIKSAELFRTTFSKYCYAVERLRIWDTMTQE